MRDVQIKVCDKQIYESHSDSNEMNFKGQLAFKNNNLYITYKDEQSGVTTIIKAKDNKVSVKRLGAVKGDLNFNVEQPHHTIYHTPHGELEMEIITGKCDVYILEKGVKICIEYKILMQGEKISDNIYMIMAN